VLKILWLILAGGVLAVSGKAAQPLVAIHDSEYTRALETQPASGATPTGTGTTGFQWWPTDWHYFVMPEAMKEALRSDGTPFTVLADSNIVAGVLLTNGQPRYPIVISLASEAIRNEEIAQFTNYVAAGGFLFVGSSAFTRNTNGTSRGDFAFANELGIHMVNPALTNWNFNNTTFTKLVDNIIISHFPTGQLTWRLPSFSEEINWGVSPSHPFLAPHDIWEITTADATVLAQGDSYPYLTLKQYGNGYFIYCSAFQPLIGHGGFGPGMYSYVMFRRAIEWAFANQNLPIPKLSPWPYNYDAAFMVRHDLENFTNEITNIELSAAFEFTNNARGDYYFCTGTLRDDATPGGFNTNVIVASMRRAVTNYGATIGPHNGGLKNPGNPSLVRGQYDYWHWGPDEALDTTPSGYPNGKAYATASISNAFGDIERWLTGIGPGLRTWVACNFNATREDSYDLQTQLNVKIGGDQKISPFPHWTLSTKTPGKRYPMLTEPVSDWYVGGLVAQSLEPWHPPGVHTSQTMHSAVDFYYNLGALINIYSHTMSTGLGAAGQLTPDYVTYGANTNIHPRVWSTNGVGIYQWWMQRSNAQISVSFATNGNQSGMTFNISGASNPNTAIEMLLPGTNQYCAFQVYTNGWLADTNVYRFVGQVLRLKVGTTITNAVMTYYPVAPSVLVFSESFDSLTAPALPAGWTTTASGAQSPWGTQAGTNDTPPNAAFSAEASNIGVNELVSPSIAVPAGQAQLTFMNDYDLENTSAAYDGGVLEIKIGTNAFMDIVDAGGSFISGGYNVVIANTTGNPLGGRAGWSGTSGGYITTSINLPASASSQNVQFKWRCGTDNSNARTGWHIDSVSVTAQPCLCCGNNNTAPTLPTQINRTIAELTSLVVTNTGTDTDSPPNVLSYMLVNPPGGAAIDSNGIITWTPSEGQGPGTYTIKTVVIDNGFPPLSDTNSFTVTVTEVNTAPVLPVLSDVTINELTTLRVTNTATDSDLPPNTLTYTLLAAPTNASISANGIITWTPTEAQGPMSTTITTRVVDNGSPPLSATNSFNVTVNEVNSAPVLPVQANRVLLPLTQLTVVNTATDSDIPVNSLTYSLINPPAGASIDANGIISWTPALNQDQTTNVITTVVTDFNPDAIVNQHLSATNSFIVVVNSRPTIGLDSTSLIMEGCTPTNNAIDPGEAVTVLFSLKNTGLTSTTNLVVTLLETNGVISPSSPQTYGILGTNGLAMSQPFTFGATGSCGGTILATLQLSDGALSLGTLTAPFPLGPSGVIFTQNFDALTIPALPSGWTTSATGALTGWYTTNALSDTPSNAAFSIDGADVGINELDSPAFALPLGPAQLSFRNFYNLEVGAGTNGYDGGVLEIQIGTNSYVDIVAAGGSFVSGGYNATIDTRFRNPFAGKPAWSGTNTSYLTTVVNLPAASAGKTIRLRWRCGTDNGNGGGGWRIDSIAVTGNLCCVNNGPILTSQGNLTIPELTTLVVTNTATDPGKVLSYVLSNPPAGAQIDSNGIITWTPSEAQGPSTNTITTIVTDNGIPPMSATNSFTVIVTEVNSTPSLPNQADRTIAELTTLVVTNTASDSDIPANTLSYSLLSPPAGAVVNASGVIFWTPTEAQGPGVYAITTVVTDNGVPPLSATNSFNVTVLEVNNPPVLPAQSPRTIAELTTLIVTNTATDSDLPANILTYALLNPPAGAAIDSNGVITWTPSEAQGPSTNILTTMVTDNGVPPLSATNSFTVVVNEINVAPVLPVQTNITVVGLTTVVVTNTATDSDLPVNPLTYALVNAPTNAVIDSSGVITWAPLPGQVPSSNLFTTVVTDFNAQAVNSQHLSATNNFTVTVAPLHNGPTLPAQPDQNIVSGTTLVVTNTASDNDIPPRLLTYVLTQAPGSAVIDSNGIISWTPTQPQDLGSNIFTTVVSDDGVPSLSATNTFTVKVSQGVNAPLILSITLSNGVVTVIWTTQPGSNYQLQYLDDLSHTNWIDLPPDTTATGPTASKSDNIGSAVQRFYRVVQLP
jgi:hypothetical protein